jgi:hypothetical protein
MWNASLSHGITLTTATGCALVLFGVSVGLVIAAVCWVCIAVPAGQQAAAPQERYASINDDEIEIVIELVHDALAGGGWTLCGDCYTRNLLQRLHLPLNERVPAEWELPVRVPAVYPAGRRRATSGAKHTRFPQKRAYTTPAGRAGGPLGRVPIHTY